MKGGNSMAHVQTESEWELEMCGRITEYLAGQIYVDMRFLEPVLNVLVPRANMGLSTFATDGVYLYMNTRHTMEVFKKNEKFLVRAYLHTVLHCVYSHLWLCDGRDAHLWNLSCDIAVERIIDRLEKACIKRILTWRRQDIYKKLDDNKCVSAAQIYEYLLEMNQDELAKLWQEFYTDDHTLWQYKNDRKNMLQQPNKVQQQWEQRARQMNMEKQKSDGESGQDSNSLNELMKVQKRRRSYRDFLKKFAEYHEELKINDDEFDLGYYAYGLSVYKNMPLIEPLETREIDKIREFVVVVDTSYSTSGELVRRFLQETFDILMDDRAFFKVSSIHIIQCDDVIQSDDVVKDREQLEGFFNTFEIKGGGNTDFRPPFKYIDRLIEEGKIKNPGGMLYFTDGEGTYPKKKPGYRTAFVFMKDFDEMKVPAWAMRIRLDKSDR